MASIISRQNKTLLDNRAKPNYTTPPCSCKNKANCRLEGRCRPGSIASKAAITSEGATRHYYGCSETEFKARFYNHNQSFKYRHKSNSTEPSKAVWQAKDAGEITALNGALWHTLHHTSPAQKLAISAS